MQVVRSTSEKRGPTDSAFMGHARFRDVDYQQGDEERSPR